MRRLFGFTLAEVLITLAIIGVVAALSIPAVISNSQQQEFKTGLRKAVSVLNSAITMNMALDGESPYDNKDLPRYLMKHMSILKSTPTVPYFSYTSSAKGNFAGETNGVFYTTDGMRYEFNFAYAWNEGANKLHESNQYACTATNTLKDGYTTVTENSDGSTTTRTTAVCGGCGSYGLKGNDLTGKPPCLILVDVNGDKKPTPANVNCKSSTCGNQNIYKVPLPSEKKVTDIFSILITEEKAIPYGVTAQKAMYQAQK